MIVVFDLDDTLYDEIEFVKSGLKAVSKYLYEKYSLPMKETTDFFNHELKKGREGILDKVLKKFGKHNTKEVKNCLSIYRKHKPQIHLKPEAKEILKELDKEFVYVLTDGNKIVQKNKIIALGIHKKVKECILTSNYGLVNAKPSPYCFNRICEKENVRPEKIVYVGDNPNKDFVGIKPLGFKTIRVLTGRYKHVKKSKKFEADITIKSLSKLTKGYINNI